MKVAGRWFYDGSGRSVLLRGVNLGGNSKTPYHPDGSTHHPFEDSPNEVSFVGRPFPLNEADEHFSRLRKWGFNCLRLLTTWEAIEHREPGVYDEKYLDYIYEIAKKADQYGFLIFIDPHQDMWSRFTGGDGAPKWTLDLAGFDWELLDPSEAAITMQNRHGNAKTIARLPNWKTPYPYSTMIWPNNRTRLACATMFTLFFAGNRFASYLKVDGTPIQDYLQNHFIDSFKFLANRLRGLSNIIGYDSLNEPAKGYLEITDLGNKLPIFSTGPVITGLQSLSIPSGFTCEVPYQVRSGLETKIDSSVQMNPLGVSAWKRPSNDIWRNLGVWDVDRKGVPNLLQPDYFAYCSFATDYLSPFINKFIVSMLEVDPETIFFVEGQPNGIDKLNLTVDAPLVNASHWYDILTLITKQYNPEEAVDAFDRTKKVFGAAEVKASFTEQIGRLVRMSETDLLGCPTLIGEFGLPYDLNHRIIYEKQDETLHIEALSSYYDAIDSNLVHSTQWNYTADHSPEWGDNWNQEDLSVFSDSKLAQDPDSDGGRAVDGFCRPYVRVCAGIPIQQSFNYQSSEYRLSIKHNVSLKSASEIYVPYQWEMKDLDVVVSSGGIELDFDRSLILWRATGDGEQIFMMRRKESSSN